VDDVCAPVLDPPNLAGMDDAPRAGFAVRLRIVRRRLLRHRRIITALLAGSCAIAAVQVWSPADPATRSVVVAAHDLAAGSVLGSGDLRTVPVAAGVLPRGAMQVPGSLVGRTLAGPLRSGEVVTDQRFVGRSLLTGYGPGLVAAPLRIPDSQVAELLAVGDRVDVFAATGEVSAAAEQIATDAAVLALPAPSELSREGALVVLAVPGTVAARLAQAMATTMLTVVLRGPT
jgi:Flp pilus assembly protein CpaB